jgi:hypothetical protein
MSARVWEQRGVEDTVLLSSRCRQLRIFRQGGIHDVGGMLTAQRASAVWGGGAQVELLVTASASL